MRIIYIAYPFGGEQENVEKVENVIKGLLHKHKGLLHKHPDCTFYSPLHATGFFYDQLPYLEGLIHCFEALSRRDELWIAGDWRNSRGCNMEHGFAEAKGIPIKVINN
ncbi:MAG: DUF4406 domain-containing protein [Candidatus Hydrogenedentes bacterium]|nr:DUF4406 domain-containing protein [Candidatus Hydrogenedentota bacterium]